MLQYEFYLAALQEYTAVVKRWVVNASPIISLSQLKLESDPPRIE